MRRVEIQHNTPEQVSEYLTAAIELTETLEVPADLRAACFTAAVNLIAAKNIQMEVPQPIDLGNLAHSMMRQ